MLLSLSSLTISIFLSLEQSSKVHTLYNESNDHLTSITMPTKANHYLADDALNCHLKVISFQACILLLINIKLTIALIRRLEITLPIRMLIYLLSGKYRVSFSVYL